MENEFDNRLETFREQRSAMNDASCAPRWGGTSPDDAKFWPKTYC